MCLGLLRHPGKLEHIRKTESDPLPLGLGALETVCSLCEGSKVPHLGCPDFRS